MKIDIMTLFPEMIDAVMRESIIGRAQDKGLVEVKATNIRDYALDKHHKADDAPYGGGRGQVMLAEPLYLCHEALSGGEHVHTVFLSAQGAPFNQEKARELLAKEHFILVCGHYEGIDQRFIDECVDEEISTFVPDGPEEGEYNLVRSKRFPIKPMTRDEAILQMNLLGHSFFAFRDEDADGAFAVVYCRNDGDYGLIEDEA